MFSVKKIFLVDGLGALVSAVFLGFVMPTLGHFFKMPLRILHILALIALIFSVYSFVCHLYLPKKWSFYLSLLALANLFYCLLTVGFVMHFWTFLTHLDKLYFTIEVILIISLVIFEIRLVMQGKK